MNEYNWSAAMRSTGSVWPAA